MANNKFSVLEYSKILNCSKQAILKRLIVGKPIRGIKHYEKIGTNKKDIWVLYPLTTD
jgi:hypothetical protein